MKKYRETLKSEHPECANYRIHDFFRGWGTYSKTGKSILWDFYRPINKKSLKIKYNNIGLTLPYNEKAAEAIKSVFDIGQTSFLNRFYEKKIF